MILEMTTYRFKVTVYDIKVDTYRFKVTVYDARDDNIQVEGHSV